MRLVIALMVVASLAGCATSTGATAQPAPSSSPAARVATVPASPSQSPSAGYKVPSPSPLPVGTPVAVQVLKPATVLPAVALCSTEVYATADGNYLPLSCRDGALNVTAWRLYVQIGPHVLAAGKRPTIDQLQTAVDADFGLHATAVEISYSYQLAAAYYGWTFPPNTPCQLIYQSSSC